MAKNQLHQLLAVENDLRTKAQKIVQETATVFSKKSEHFDGMIKTYEPLVEGGDERSFLIPPEIKEIVTTVEEKLQHTQKSLAEAINAQLSKEETNTSGLAQAPLVIDSVSFGEFSATALLALESNLTRVRQLYDLIPTLDPVRRWEKDETRGNVYVTKPQQTFRTEKRSEVITLAPATEQHPAQAQLVVVDKQVGKMSTIYSSGRITPREKSERLARVDNLILAVKRARARANQAEVKSVKIARKMFNFIDRGTLPKVEGEKL